jgi:hypothetical protein
MKIKDRFLLSIAATTAVVVIPTCALADLAEPADPGQALGMLGQLIEAVKVKNWGVLASILIMLLVYGMRQIGLPKLKDKPALLAVVSQGLGCLVGIAMSLYTGANLWNALLGGLFIGAAASGFWSAIFKYLLPVKATADEPKV